MATPRGSGPRRTGAVRRAPVRAVVGAIIPSVLLTVALAACGGDDTTANRTAGPTASTMETEPAMSSSATVSDLLSNPNEWIGRTVSVTGKVFFLAQCPPPGATAGPCVLLAYLAAPERGVLTSADRHDAVPLTHDGRRVSCLESHAVNGACEDWIREAVYVVEGALEYRILGDRESDRVQFEVLRRSGPID